VKAVLSKHLTNVMQATGVTLAPTKPTSLVLSVLLDTIVNKAQSCQQLVLMDCTHRKERKWKVTALNVWLVTIAFDMCTPLK